MFSSREWKAMYNNVFKVFPSPDNIPQKIILKTKQGKRVFKSSSEFLSYICINGNGNILNDDLEYVLEDNKLKSEVENNINVIINTIKKERI